MNHTKTPWAHEGTEIVTDWKHDGGRVIAIAAHGSRSNAPRLDIGDDDWDLQMANLTFIATAVNAHDALVEALKFYADERKYQGANCKADDDEETVAGYYRLDVSRDGGNKARKVLAALAEGNNK